MYFPGKKKKNPKPNIISYTPHAIGSPPREMAMGGTCHSPARIQHSYFSTVDSKLQWAGLIEVTSSL